MNRVPYKVPLNKFKKLPAPRKANRAERTNFTNGSKWNIKTELRQLSLTGQNIKGKTNNQFQRFSGEQKQAWGERTGDETRATRPLHFPRAFYALFSHLRSHLSNRFVFNHNVNIHLILKVDKWILYKLLSLTSLVQCYHELMKAYTPPEKSQEK